MFSLDKRQVDWQKEYEDWDLTCLFCHGREDGCDECRDGFLEPIWNTVWDVGFGSSREAIPEVVVKKVWRQTNCMLVFNYEEDKWYLTLSGCGMDLTPDLCYAWLLIGFQWLPLDWVMNLDVRYRAYLSKNKFRKVLRVARKTLRTAAVECKQYRAKLREIRVKEVV